MQGEGGGGIYTYSNRCEGALETSDNLDTMCTGDIPLKKAKEELYEHTVKPQGEATEDTGMVLVVFL